MNKTVDIVIVNWNSGHLLADCLDSINKSKIDFNVLGKVVVVDNNSADDSMENLPNLQVPLIIEKNSENIGFAAACNQGAKHGEGSYLLFLNPDTKIFENTIIDSWHFFEEADSSIGILGVQLVNESGKISRTCARFPRTYFYVNKVFGLNKLSPSFQSYLMLEWDHSQSRQVDQVIGAYFFVKRSLFEDLNGFDERYFVYFEEVDFSLRAKQKGYKSYYLSSVKVFHKGGGVSEQVKAKRLFYSLRSRILYALKHFSVISVFALLVITFFIEPFVRIIFCLVKRRPIDEVNEIVRAYKMLFMAIPNLKSP